MKKNTLLFIVSVLLLLSGVGDIFAQERPVLRQLSEKKAQVALDGIYPMVKNDLWGYADAEGKFLIRPVFSEVMPMSAMKVGFVAYQNAAGAKVWTLVDFMGTYLTEVDFDAVVADFDDRNLAVVMKDGKYGILNHAGQMFVECIFETYLERGPVRLLRTSASSDWVAVVKDASDAGVTVYSFGEGKPIIVRAENGYGIISPRTQTVVADFIHDSVQELVPESVYCLQKGTYKYLYADDSLSVHYEEVIPAADNAYFVVKQDGIFGIVSQTAKPVVDCKYTTHKNYGAVQLFQSPSLSECEVVVKDSSEVGYSVHTFDVKENIIVKAESGYGIIDPRNQEVVADFIYDSVQEYVPGTVYCLQKEAQKYLYAGNKLSVPFEEIIPGPSYVYYIVKQNGLYGVLHRDGSLVLDCLYATRLDHGAVLLLRAEGASEWVAVAKDLSAAGYTVYTFGDNDPIILKAENGYGIINTKTQSVVADFVYDSVWEYVPGTLYCLNKGEGKYLYAGNDLSLAYEEVTPGPSDVYFIVKQNGLYGIVHKDGSTVLECVHSICQNHGAVLLLRAEGATEWVAVAKDFSATGYTVYTFAENEPIIVRAENGYGIISPRTQAVVADFVYDSVQEYVSGSVYCLQKGAYKYLYADDKLSAQNEEVIPDSDIAYFIVKQNGLYGVLDRAGKVVVDCKYTTCLSHGSVMLLQSASLPECVVVVKDSSETGYSVQNYPANENAIVKTEDGYGIVDPRTQTILADFIYDSIHEYVHDSEYCLQKDGYKYLYVAGKLSIPYEDVILSPDEDYFIVRENGLYGAVDHAGEVLAQNIYASYLNRGPVLLLRTSESTDWYAMVKDPASEKYIIHTFGENDPIIVKAAGGYGIISHKDQSVVADFIYDSVEEYVHGSIYCLGKDAYKYLCINEVISSAYEEVIPGEENGYFVVKQEGLYGVMTPKGEILLPCSQTEVPVLKKDEYTRFYVDGVPVYVRVDELITATQYDDYLYEKYQETPADYLLDETLTFDLKKYVHEAVERTYGTYDFARIMGIKEAVEYAESRRFILLSSDEQEAGYLDLETREIRNSGEVVYHAFPSKEGYPMYASALRDGKFGIIDIRTRATVIPFDYDRIIPVGNDYVLLQTDATQGRNASVYLYNVTQSLMVTPNACESASLDMISDNLVSLKLDSKEKIYNIEDHSWVLPDDHTLVSYVRLPQDETYAAFMKKDGKGAFFSLLTGEPLTDYLFDDVAKELAYDKYHLVTVDGKQGLYDFSMKQYMHPCLYQRIESYYKYGIYEYVVVSVDKKCGLYNVKTGKLDIPAIYDEIELKGSYALLRQGKLTKIYSCAKRNMITLGVQYEHIELLEDGYALMFTASASGVYDMYRSRWQFSFGSRKRKDFAAGDFCDLGNNLLFIPTFGVLNYLTCNWQVRADISWALWAERSDDYIELTGGTKGDIKAVYSIKRDRLLMKSDKTLKMYPVTDDQNLESEYMLFHSYGSPSWMPWGDEAGAGAGLYDIDEKSWFFGNENGLNYFGSGLLYVADKGVYDMILDGWVFNTANKLDYFMEAGNLYVEEKDADGQTVGLYWFDTEARGLVPVSATFSIFDYDALKTVNGVGNYNPKASDKKWKLYDSQENSYISYECDRISLMHKE